MVKKRFSTSSDDSDDGDDRRPHRDECIEKNKETDREEWKKRSTRKNIREDDVDKSRNREELHDNDKQREKRKETDRNNPRKRSREYEEATNSNREEYTKRMDNQNREKRREVSKEHHRRERSNDRDDRRRDRDSRSDRRGHYDKSGSKFHRREQPPYWRKDRPHHFHSHRYSHEEEEEPSGDRPAWATKAVMKRAEEIQQRKLLWSKPDEKRSDGASCEDTGTAASSTGGSRPSTASTWNSIFAAASVDSKQIDKFKRLMGMKKSDEPSASTSNEATNEQVEAERQRQRALYSQLDQQYAIARSTTHLSRGQGLGFHS